MEEHLGNEFHAIIAIIALVVVIGAVAVYFDKRRRGAFLTLAREKGFTHPDSDQALLDAGFAGFPIFKLGFSRDYENIMKGEVEGLPAILFDYKYMLSQGKHTVRQRQTVICYRMKRKDLPKFELSPETLLDKVGAVLGLQDIDFESHRGFSKTYLLRGQEELAIRDLFKADLLSYLEAHPGWSVNGGGEWLVLYKPNRRATAQNFHDYLSETRGIASQFG